MVNFDLIDNSLENLLLNLSYKINQELYKANLIKKMISQDSFDYLVSKRLMIKHPHPFIINFDFNMNQLSSFGDNLSNIILPKSFYWGTATASHQVEGDCTNNNWYATRVDGKVLQDKNNWSTQKADTHPNGLSPAVTIDEATGGLPILNTVNGGNIASSGTRLDYSPHTPQWLRDSGAIKFDGDVDYLSVPVSYTHLTLPTKA